MAIPTPEQLIQSFGQYKGGLNAELNNTWDCQVSDISTKAEVLGAGFLDPVADKLRIGDEVKFRTTDEGTLTTNVMSITFPVTVIDKTGSGVDIPALTPGGVLFGGLLGAIEQDTTSFFYDKVENSLGLGSAPTITQILNLSSTDKGFAGPRMTQAQRLAIPVAGGDLGLHVYDFDSGAPFWYTGTGVIWDAPMMRSGGADVPSGSVLLGSGLLVQNEVNLTWDGDTLQVGAPIVDANAGLSVNSTTQASKPIPRMTEAERDAIPSPQQGMQIHNTTTGEPNYYDVSWKSFIYNPARANLYVSSPAETSISTSNVYVKIAGTTTGNLLKDFTTGASMQLTYTGTQTHVFEVNVSLSLESASSQEEFEVAVFVDTGGGFVLHVPSEMDEQVRDSNKSDAMSLNTLIQLSTNDKLELHVKNITSPAATENCTANRLTWIISQNGS